MVEKKEVKSKQVRSSPKCGICGEIGHRSHLCLKAPGGPLETERVNTNREMTESEYDSAKEAREHQMSPVDIASKINVSVREVNLALKAYSYQSYKDSR